MLLLTISLSERVVFSAKGDTGFVAGDERGWFLCVSRGGSWQVLYNGKPLGEFKDAFGTEDQGEDYPSAGVILTKGEEWFVGFGGKLWGPYAELRGVVIAGRSWGGVELADDGTYMIINGRRHGPYHYEWRPPLPSFSPDGSDWGFLYQNRAGWFVKMGDVLIGPFLYIKPPHFSNGGKRWGFVCRKKGRGWFTVLNFTNLGPYDEVAHFSVSPDGSAAAFAFRRGKEWFVWLDGVVLGPYEDIGELVAGEKALCAFSFKKSGKWFVHLDDGDRGPYEGVYSLSLRGMDWGYCVVEGEGGYAVVSGRKVKLRGVPSSLGLGPGGRWWATYALGEEQWLSVDGKDLGPFRWAPTPRFAEEGHWAAVVVDTATWVLVDGRRAGPFISVAMASPRKIYALKRKGSKLEVVVLGVSGN